jgi:cytochrome c oxidase subunit IV
MTKTPIGTPVYLAIFAALIALTAATVGLSYVELGVWHGPVGLGIAGAKAMLIVLFFMHLVRSPRLTWAVAVSGVFWLVLLIALTLADVLTRAWPT